MMINCPKCNLLQPKDQYCAGCGINMESWEPPQKPKWKKFLGNWMVQLGLLFLVIFAVVLRDNFTTHSKKTTRSDLPPVSSTIARDDSVAQPTETPQPALQESVQSFKSTRATESTQKAIQLTNEKQTNSSLRKQMIVKVYSLTKLGLDKISQSARKDDGALIVTSQFATQFRSQNKNNFKSFGTRRKQYEFGEPVDFFIGEQDLETGLNIGFYAQILVSAESRPESITAEVRFWNQLKLEDDPSPPLSFTINMRQQDQAFIVDMGVHDLDFTQEERGLFEASPKLKILNNEDFMESLSDIALVLEVK